MSDWLFMAGVRMLMLDGGDRFFWKEKADGECCVDVKWWGDG
jgi:hypothetical protein